MKELHADLVIMDEFDVSPLEQHKAIVHGWASRVLINVEDRAGVEVAEEIRPYINDMVKNINQATERLERATIHLATPVKIKVVK